jgi:TPR repeat protein
MHLHNIIWVWCFSTGMVAKDEMKAFEWFLKSAEQRDARAQYNLG